MDINTLELLREALPYIQRFKGSTFVVKESSGPVTYKYGEKVTYVTKSGKEIPEAELKTRIKVGSPVSVHYSGDADHRTVTRVEIDD